MGLASVWELGKRFEWDWCSVIKSSFQLGLSEFNFTSLGKEAFKWFPRAIIP